MTRRALLMAILLVGAGLPVSANPVPDEIAHDFQTLVKTTYRESRCPDPTRLARHFGRFGLNLLDPWHVRMIELRFRTFAPILVQSQRPPYEVSGAIQDLYRRLANSREERAMVASLEDWLSADVKEAPWHGSMRVDGPEDFVKWQIDLNRLRAAEELGERRAVSAVPLLDAMQRRQDWSPEQRRHVRRAALRMSDPCALTLIRVGRRGKVIACAEAARLRSALIVRQDGSRSLVSATESRQLWQMVRDSRALSWPSDRHGGTFPVPSLPLRIEFEDGLLARLEPQGDEFVAYWDNATVAALSYGSSSFFQTRWYLKNRQLARRLAALLAEDEAGSLPRAR